MTFSVDVKAWAEKAGLDIVKAKRAAALQVFSAVIFATPVGNSTIWKVPRAPRGYVGGRLRGNWQTSVGAPKTTQLDRVDGAGLQAIDEALHTIELAVGDDKIYMTNNLPYAGRIEYGAHSKQAPTGMVRVSVLAWQKAVKAAIQ